MSGDSGSHPPRQAEPWLRGIRFAVDPIVEPVLFALEQAREDLEWYTAGLGVALVWTELPGIPTLGFQLRHIAGSLDRLATYLEGDALSEAQFEALATERLPGASREELIQSLGASLSRAAATIAALDPATYPDRRLVGRQRIPTTVIGLAIHIAEHTQRHCGQAITTAKLLAAQNRP